MGAEEAEVEVHRLVGVGPFEGGHQLEDAGGGGLAAGVRDDRGEALGVGGRHLGRARRDPEGDRLDLLGHPDPALLERRRGAEAEDRAEGGELALALGVFEGPAPDRVVLEGAGQGLADRRQIGLGGDPGRRPARAKRAVSTLGRDRLGHDQGSSAESSSGWASIVASRVSGGRPITSSTSSETWSSEPSAIAV